MNHLSLGLELPSVALRACILSRILLFATPWTVAHQPPLSMGFSRQEFLSELLALLQGTFPAQGSNLSLLCLLHWQVDSFPPSHLFYHEVGLTWRHLTLFPLAPKGFCLSDLWNTSTLSKAHKFHRILNSAQNSGCHYLTQVWVWKRCLRNSS